MERNKEVIKEILLAESDTFGDYLELGIDELLDDGILDGIPIVKSINSVYKVGKNINNAFFYKKLISFIYHLRDISLNDRTNFIDRYTKDDKEFSEKLLYIIDKLDETNKSKYLSNIFKNYGKERIDYDTFRRFCIILTNTYIGDIEYLRENIGKQFGGTSAIALKSNGLVEQNIIDCNLEIGEGDVYCATAIGEEFINCLF